jgi:hypothetical protein
MATQDEYERWQRGESPVTECAQLATRLLRKEIESDPRMRRDARYAFVVGVMTASVPDAIRDEMFTLIRGGEADN